VTDDPDARRRQSELRVLILVKGVHEGELTRRLLDDAHIPSTLCCDALDLYEKLEEGAGAVLLAEELLTDKLGAELERRLARQPPWSDLPILIFSAAAKNAGTRAAAAALGNVTFLDRPLHVRTMVAAVQSALRSRERQYQARHAIESRDGFLAMLGHELRNPLGAITLALASMSRKGHGPPAREFDVMDRQVRHLVRLVDELLDVARVTHGKVAIQRRPLNIVEVAKSAFEAFEARAQAQDLRYDLEISTLAAFVLGDPQRLEQVIGNLLANAIKYTPRGGAVSLSVSASPDRILVAVSDTGDGIAPEMCEKIFAPFTQVDSSLDRSQGGLGLGLALVQAIVSLHEGRVSAHSPGLGQGSRFEVELPRSDAPAATPQLPSSSPQQAPALRIVLVEDNADIRELFVDMLQHSGHTVEAAHDGPSGLDALIALQPDLAFVDVGLPGFDGYELARRARASGSRARLIALTGYGQRDDKLRASEAGFDEHLVKPVADEDLQRAIARAGA